MGGEAAGFGVQRTKNFALPLPNPEYPVNFSDTSRRGWQTNIG